MSSKLDYFEPSKTSTSLEHQEKEWGDLKV